MMWARYCPGIGRSRYEKVKNRQLKVKGCLLAGILVKFSKEM
jgi:hypothetical protein